MHVPRDAHRGRRGRTRRLSFLLAAPMLACSNPTTVNDVARIAVTPDSAAIRVGSQVPLSAKVYDAAGDVVSAPSLYWSSEDAEIATVSASGTVTAITPGRARIAGSADGVSGVATITVMPVVVAHVAITAASLTIQKQDTARLQAAAYDASGNAITGVAVVWGSSNSHIATVDGSGLVTGVAAGKVTISAAISGVLDNAGVTVLPHAGKNGS